MSLKSFAYGSIRYNADTLEILDQKLLPDIEQWIPCSDPEDMAKNIQRLSVRGAPLIGIAAAVCLAVYAQKGASFEELRQAVVILKSTRPTAVNLMYALNKQISFLHNREQLANVAHELIDQEVTMCHNLSQ